MDRLITQPRILITGASGYIGGILYELFSKTNFLIEGWSYSMSNENFITVDITDIVAIEKAISKFRPNYVIHCAALIDRNWKQHNYNQLWSVNVIGTENILKSLNYNDFKEFIYISTSEVYGNLKHLRRERDIVDLKTPYAMTKYMGERTVESYARLFNFGHKILRLTNPVYSQLCPNSFLSDLSYACNNNLTMKMSRGEQVRNFFHLKDLFNLLTEFNSYSGVVNVGSNFSIELKELALNLKRMKEQLE